MGEAGSPKLHALIPSGNQGIRQVCAFSEHKSLHGQIEQTGGCRGEGCEEIELADVSCYIRMYKQQVPTLQHKELYSIFCDKQ